MRYNEFNISDPVQELEKRLVRIGRGPLDINVIKRLVNRISLRHKIPKETLHGMFVKKHGHSPDAWVKKIKARLSEVDKDPTDKESLGYLQYFAKPSEPKKPEQPKVYRGWEEYEKERTPVNKKDPVSETVDDEHTEAQIRSFIEWAKKTLHVKGNPKFTFSKDTEVAQKGHHTGVHSGNNIWVYIGNRNLVDIFRTVFHELVHQRQEELNMIKPGDSYPGSPIEAMADMLAGKYIKIYGKEHPEIFQ